MYTKHYYVDKSLGVCVEVFLASVSQCSVVILN